MALASNSAPPQTEEFDGTPTTRPNPVALEALVTVTGARPSSEGSRGLFTEETKTILVFVDGAVIQLAAGVSVGQLLFVTNKKSNEEVVCQIIHKRVFRPTVCYVELQFTEEKPNFWGVAFPKGGAKSAEFTIAEHVAAEETTEDDLGTPVAAHSEAEVERLKSQVEMLRKQLQELEKRKAEEAAGQSAESTGGNDAPVIQANGKQAAKPYKEELAPVNDPTPTQLAVVPSEEKSAGEALLMPAAAVPAPQKRTLRWAVPMVLPNQNPADEKAVKSERDPSEDLLPKPELDFSRIPSAVNVDDSDPRSIYKPRGLAPEKIRLIALVLVLAGVVGAGACLKAWTRLPLLKNAVVGLSRSFKSGGNTAGGAISAAGDTQRRTVADAGKTTNADESAKLPASAGAESVGTKTDVKQSDAPARTEVGGGAAPVGTNAEVEMGADGSAMASAGGAAAGKQGEVGANRSANGRERTASKKRAEARTPTKEKLEEVVDANAPVIAPKLVHATTPVYPPDAMLNYITGDVKAELVVEATGKVGEVKVISGPKSLREAAIEALKQYEYAPATQGGKAVASRATATVKFWFNP